MSIETGDYRINSIFDNKQYYLHSDGDKVTSAQGYEDVWNLSRSGQETYYITLVNSNLVIDVAGGNQQPGTQITLDGLTGRDTQEWRFIPLDHGSNPPQVAIVSSTNNRLGVTAMGDGSVMQCQLQTVDLESDRQGWILQKL